MMQHRLLLSLSLALVLSTVGFDARAFCGFYVSGANTKLYNNATMVVMMREGKRTVLSMQNNYQGPAEDFAMVVPVPVVLQKENVKTLPKKVFDRIDTLAAPRLVEYWEQDPCVPHGVGLFGLSGIGRGGGGGLGSGYGSGKGRTRVKVEAQFAVGEYDVVVLSAEDSGGLARWLVENKYKIPPGAEPLLRPYVQEGMKFFVARVNTKKVTMKDGQAMLSPLRFHYDDDKFRLPVRLGLINAKGKQDLIVHILAKKRYEAANLENVTIPTNVTVTNETRENFAAFYAQLFDTTLAKNPKAVVTEYSWSSSSCDPCPTPPLKPADLALFGNDVLPAAATKTPSMTDKNGKPLPPEVQRRLRRQRRRGGMVLTRLHVRYDKASLAEDLVFKPAEAIAGGRERVFEKKGLERGSRKDRVNNFQARYAIRHEWTGAMACEKPIRGRWGAKPVPKDPKKNNAGVGVASRPTSPVSAKNLAFVPRGQTKLASFVTEPIAEIGFTPDPSKVAKAPSSPAPREAPSSGPSAAPVGTAPAPSASATSSASPGTNGSSSCSLGAGHSPAPTGAWLMALGLAFSLARRR